MIKVHYFLPILGLVGQRCLIVYNYNNGLYHKICNLVNQSNTILSERSHFMLYINYYYLNIVIVTI